MYKRKLYSFAKKSHKVGNYIFIHQHAVEQRGLSFDPFPPLRKLLPSSGMLQAELNINYTYFYFWVHHGFFGPSPHDSQNFSLIENSNTHIDFINYFYILVNIITIVP